MFCPKCGKQEADGTAFCSACGAAMTATAQNPNSEAPKAGFRPSAKDRGLTVKEFLAKEASPKAKTFSLGSLIAFALAALLILISVISASNTAFYKLPPVALVMEDGAEEEMDEMMEELQDTVDDARDWLDDNEDELDLDDDALEIVNELLDAMEELAKNPSLSGLINAVDKVQELAEENLPEEVEDRLDLDDMEEFNEAADILSAVQTALYIYAIIIIALAALAAFLKKMGFAVAAIIVNALPCLILSGFVWFLLITVALIALCVTLSKINAEYKALQPIEA